MHMHDKCIRLYRVLLSATNCPPPPTHTVQSVTRNAFFGQGTGDILLDNLMCTGTEASLIDCPHNGVSIHNCGHSEDAGVICRGIKSYVLLNGRHNNVLSLER